jgi:hypothetical protein
LQKKEEIDLNFRVFPRVSRANKFIFHNRQPGFNRLDRLDRLNRLARLAKLPVIKIKAILPAKDAKIRKKKNK